MGAALGEPIKPGQRLSSAATVYDDPLMDMVLVAHNPEVPAVLELASQFDGFNSDALRIPARSPLSPEELEMIRRGIEAFDDIGALSTTKYAVSLVATGRTFCPSFRPKTNE